VQEGLSYCYSASRGARPRVLNDSCGMVRYAELLVRDLEKNFTEPKNVRNSIKRRKDGGR